MKLSRLHKSYYLIFNDIPTLGLEQLIPLFYTAHVRKVRLVLLEQDPETLIRHKVEFIDGFLYKKSLSDVGSLLYAVWRFDEEGTGSTRKLKSTDYGLEWEILSDLENL